MGKPKSYIVGPEGQAWAVGVTPGDASFGGKAALGGRKCMLEVGAQGSKEDEAPFGQSPGITPKLPFSLVPTL